MLLAVSLIFFLALNCLIVVAWYVALVPADLSPLDRAIGAILSALAQIAFTLIFFGLIGRLSFWYVVIFNVLVSFLLLSRYRFFWPRLTADMRSWLAVWRQSRVIRLALVIAGLFVLWQAVVAFQSDEVGFDAVVYHLPWAATVLQERAIGFFSTPVPWVNLYPKNGELWSLWYLLIVRDGRLVDFSQIFFWVLAGLALGSLSRKFKLSRVGSIIAVVSFLTVPLVATELRSNYIDLGVAALVIAAVNFLAVKNFGRQHWLLLAATLGLLLGFKSTAILWVAILCAAAWLWHRRSLGAVWLPALALILALGGFWYARNWLIFGSPIYPAKITFGPLTIIPGALSLSQILVPQNIDAYWQQSYGLQLWWNLTHHGLFLFDVNHGGFGRLWLPILLPLTLFFVWRLITGRNYRRLAVIALLILLAVVTPANFWLRYILWLPAVSGLALGWLSDRRFYGRQLAVLAVILIAWFNITLETPITKPVYWSEVYHEDLGPLAPYQTAGSVLAYDSRWFKVWPLWNRRLSNEVIYLPWGDDWLVEVGQARVGAIIGRSDSDEWNSLQHQKNFGLKHQEESYGLWVTSTTTP